MFAYREPDGRIFRELRLPEEVFAEDSLASLRDAPVLEGHPAMVSAANWREHSRGNVSGVPTVDGCYVFAPLAIQDGATVGRIDRGELSEVSCGYVCKLDVTPGEYQGEKYDAIQREIRYNHVGLGPKGWGRAGSEVSLRLDGGVCDHTDSGEIPQKDERMPTIKFDGQDFEAGSKEHMVALYAKIDGQSGELATLRKEKDTLDGQLTAAKTEVEGLKVKLDAANDQSRIDAAVKERLDLVSRAAPVLGIAYKFDGKSDVEVMTDAIKVHSPKVSLDGRSVDFVKGLFEAACASGVRADSIEAVPGVIAKVTLDRVKRADKAEPKLPAHTPVFEAPALNQGAK